MKQVCLLFCLMGWLLVSMAQNVGIGTSSPMEKLSIVTGHNNYGFSHSDGTIKMASFIGNNQAYFGTTSNHPLSFITNGSVVPMTLTTAGNVGIGNSNPQFTLDVTGRIRLRTGTIGNIYTSSGIWFDDFRDGSNRIFLGMKDSISLGFWGDGIPGAGWAFDFNARTGQVSAKEYKYLSPRNNYYMVGGTDFQPSNHTDKFQIFSSLGTITMFGGTGELIAPVHLPHGAIITSLIIYFNDSQATENLKVNLFAGTGQYLPSHIATAVSSGTPGQSSVMVAPLNYTVDNSTEFLYLSAYSTTGTWTDNNLLVNRVLIYYTTVGPD